MRTLFVATAAFAALMIGAPIGKGHAAELTCPDAAIAVHEVLAKLPGIMDKVATLHAKGRNQAELQEWGNAAFHGAREGIGAVKYGLANCQGFEQFGEDLSAWKMTADNLKSLGFH